MKSIFFDLETSDKNTIGQILNYCFIFVDDDYSILDELSGIVRISRLQLPAADAILANRINVIEHQSLASDSEARAMQKIHDFIASCIETNTSNGKLPIVGYNSSRFDIPYLRTSFIRNGINPYFNGRIVLRDLLFATRKLAACQADFPRTCSSNPKKGSERISYSLENMTQQFGLLSGVQSHESRADVLLTIALAQKYEQLFKFDVRTFEPFEALRDIERPQRGLVRWIKQINYDPGASNTTINKPLLLLDYDHKSSLWIDLMRYHETPARSAISWFNHNGGHQFILAPHEPLSPVEQTLADSALERFSDVTLKNFFDKSTCDIEQDIYRLDFAMIDQLSHALRSGDRPLTKKGMSRDLEVVYLRFQLANAADERPFPPAFEKGLRAYANYRYGGKAQLSKQLPAEGADDEILHKCYHPDIAQMFARIENLKASEQDQESLKLLESLESFYRRSDIVRLIDCESK